MHHGLPSTRLRRWPRSLSAVGIARWPEPVRGRSFLRSRRILAGGRDVGSIDRRWARGTARHRGHRPRGRRSHQRIYANAGRPAGCWPVCALTSGSGAGGRRSVTVLAQELRDSYRRRRDRTRGLVAWRPCLDRDRDGVAEYIRTIARDVAIGVVGQADCSSDASRVKRAIRSIWSVLCVVGRRCARREAYGIGRAQASRCHRNRVAIRGDAVCRRPRRRSLRACVGAPVRRCARVLVSAYDPPPLNRGLTMLLKMEPKL